MANKGLTLTMIFAAESANFGEGFGNLSILKKMTRGDGRQYSYISRQALRYNIIQQLGWDHTPVHNDNKVVQYAPTATIADYPEIDLFGYMKTVSKSKDESGKGGAATRSAVVRLSNAIALEPFRGDMDFLTNMGLARRGGFDNAIAQSEIHAAYYAYTIAIDLECVGEDKAANISLDSEEKARRVNALLDVLQFLYRDIRGRRENLAPIFAIGGVYLRKNPFFENRVKVQKNQLHTMALKEAISADDDLAAHTYAGVCDGLFDNTAEIKKELHADTVAMVFKALQKEVCDYYGG